MAAPKTSSVTSASIPAPDNVQVFLQPRSLNLADAAKYAGVKQWTLSEAIMSGSLPAKKPGRERIVLVRDLDAWLDSLDNVKPSTAPSIQKRKSGVA
jgi:excisionase family DNA binding protein